MDQAKGVSNVYFRLSYQLCLSDILEDIPDLSYFCLCLQNEGALTGDEASHVTAATDDVERKNRLLKALLVKKEDWLTSGVFMAISDTDKTAADNAMIRVLHVFSLLEMVLNSNEPLDSSIWGDHPDRTCPDDELDAHLRRMAYLLALPAALTRYITDTESFTSYLVDTGAITPWVRDVTPVNIRDLTYLLIEKGEGVLSRDLSFLVMEQKAYCYVLDKVLDTSKISLFNRVAGKIKNRATGKLSAAAGLTIGGLTVGSVMASAMSSVTSRAATSAGAGLATRAAARLGLSALQKYALVGLGSAGAGVGAVLATPVVIGAVGFGAGGIAAGSLAASLMSLYGGYVTTGSLCALLQSAGAVGLGASAKAAIGAGVTGVSASLMSVVMALVRR